MKELATFFLVGHNPASLNQLCDALNDRHIRCKCMTIAEAETTFERADVVLIDLDDADDGVAAAHRIAEFHGSIVATISSEDMHQDGITHFQKPLDAAAITLLLDRVGAAQQSI